MGMTPKTNFYLQIGNICYNYDILKTLLKAYSGFKILKMVEFMYKKIIIALNLLISVGITSGMDYFLQKEGPDCNRPTDVILTLQDGSTYPLTENKAQLCVTLRNIINDLSYDNAPIPLDLIDIETCKKIDILLNELWILVISQSKAENEIVEILCKKIDNFALNKQQFIDLLNGINFLDCDLLLKAAITSFACWCIQQDCFIDCPNLCAEISTAVGSKIVELAEIKEHFYIPRLIFEKKYEGTVQGAFEKEPLSVTDIQFSNLNYFGVQTNNESGLEVYNLLNGNCILEGTGCFAFLPDAFRVALHSDLTTSVIDLNIIGSEDNLLTNSISWNLDKQDYLNGRLLRKISKLTYSSDEKWCALYNRTLSHLYLVDTEKNKVIKKYTNEGFREFKPQGQFCFSNDGSMFAFTISTINSQNDPKSIVSTVATTDFSEEEFEIPQAAISTLCFSPNDYYIVACCPTKGTVTIFDRTQKKPYNFPLFAKDKKGLDVYTVFFTNDESKCVVSSATKCCIIDLIAMKSIAQFGNTRNPEAVYSIVNDKYYCTITKKKAYIREIKDGKLYKEFSAPPLINNSYNSCVTLQRNSPDGKFFAQVVQYTQSSWSARDDSSYDIVYIWDCSGIDHYTYLTIEQVLLLREIIKNNNIQVYTCGF